MDKKTLLIFVRRILNGASIEKSKRSLLQLYEILKEQGADESVIKMIEKIIKSVPEMKEFSEKDFLTEADVIIAERRARERIARENAARSYSRFC